MNIQQLQEITLNSAEIDLEISRAVLNSAQTIPDIEQKQTIINAVTTVIHEGCQDYVCYYWVLNFLNKLAACFTKSKNFVIIKH